MEVELRTMNSTVELVLKHKKANMRKSEFLMLEALKSAPHLSDRNTILVKLKLWELVIVFNKTFWSATNLCLRYASAKCGR